MSLLKYFPLPFWMCTFPIFLCCCSVSRLCLTLWNAMDCSLPGFPVLYYISIIFLRPLKTHFRVVCPLPAYVRNKPPFLRYCSNFSLFYSLCHFLFFCFVIFFFSLPRRLLLHLLLKWTMGSQWCLSKFVPSICWLSGLSLRRCQKHYLIYFLVS